MILQRIIAVIFLLFCICFIAIVIEETFLGGRRRRKLERETRRERNVREPND
jgi:preprotein translocase subunit SecG